MENKASAGLITVCGCFVLVDFTLHERLYLTVVPPPVEAGRVLPVASVPPEGDVPMIPDVFCVLSSVSVLLLISVVLFVLVVFLLVTVVLLLVALVTAVSLVPFPVPGIMPLCVVLVFAVVFLLFLPPHANIAAASVRTKNNAIIFFIIILR